MRGKRPEFNTRSTSREALSVALAGGLIMTAVPVIAISDATSPTGTHIKNSEAVELLPLTVIDRESIEFSGKTSVADLLRDLPFNSFGSPRPQSGSPAQSFAGLSMRGLGVGRTLILLDGRRLPVAPNTGEGQNLNVVPLAAVERIEIFPAGASAIYGSDAMGGVVNIITRKDFPGVELTVGISEPARSGGETEEGAVIFGASDDRGRVMAGVSYNSRDIVFARDREWSRDGASIFSNNFLNTNFTFLQHPEFGSANVAGCQGEGFSLGNAGSSTRCLFDFTLVSADEAATSNESVFFRAGYDINDDWTIFAGGTVSRVESFGRYAPVPSSPWPVLGQFSVNFGAIPLTPGSPNHPATPPGQGGLNPNWEAYQGTAGDTLLLTHRFAANGPRDTSTDAVTYDLEFGLQGRIGGFEVDLGVRRTESQYLELGRNYIVSTLAQPQIDTGTYDIYDPFGVSQDVLQSFSATISRNARTVQKEAYALARANLPIDLGAGPVNLAFGAEYREEVYRDIYGDLVANGNITGTGGSSRAGWRSSRAAFGEILVPVLDTLTLSGALHYADHSPTGSVSATRYALSWQPVRSLTLRASGARHFRAPSLAVLGQQTLPSTAETVIDPSPGFDIEHEVPSFLVANTDVDFEKGREFRLGMDFEPVDWLRASLDVWEIEIDDRVVMIPGQLVAFCIVRPDESCPPGLRELPAVDDFPDASLGLGAARDPFNPGLWFVQTGFSNFGELEARGGDLRMRARKAIGNGLVGADLLTSHVDDYRVGSAFQGSGENSAGDVGRPDWRAWLQVFYDTGDIALSWNINHVGDQATSREIGEAASLPSWTTHDIQVNWYAPWNGRITLGIDNLADKAPVLDSSDERGFNSDLYDGYGRIWYLRYQQSW